MSYTRNITMWGNISKLTQFGTSAFYTVVR